MRGACPVEADALKVPRRNPKTRSNTPFDGKGEESFLEEAQGNGYIQDAGLSFAETASCDPGGSSP